MMPVSNDNADMAAVYKILLDIREQSGANGAVLDQHTKQFEDFKQWALQHVQDDKKMGADIAKIEIRQAQQSGMLKALAGAGTVVGALIGYGIDLLVGRGHH